MYILTIRTDKPESEVGLFNEEKELTYVHWQAHRQLAETLHAQIQHNLKAHSVQINDIKGIVVYEGPGSFTGLRIGISVANAFAYGLGVSIVQSTGDDWLSIGIKKLLNNSVQKLAIPIYGSEVHITRPKK